LSYFYKTDFDSFAYSDPKKDKYMTAVHDLINSSKMLQMITERLNITSKTKAIKHIEMNPELIELILDLYNDDADFPFEKMQRFSVEEILDYLQTTHHYYLNKKLPEIEQSLLHIFSKYSKSHQLLASLAIFFNIYKNKLIDHILMEEKQLFPYIRRMIVASKVKSVCAESLEIDLEFSIEKFISSHSPIEDELKEVSEIIKQYSVNKTTPLPFKVFLNQVELFELELRKHAIIEDHVLVPMVIELEKKTKHFSN
jgi:regulator of cell morphogenesis and NO signaling